MSDRLERSDQGSGWPLASVLHAWLEELKGISPGKAEITAQQTRDLVRAQRRNGYGNDTCGRDSWGDGTCGRR